MKVWLLSLLLVGVLLSLTVTAEESQEAQSVGTKVTVHEQPQEAESVGTKVTVPEQPQEAQSVGTKVTVREQPQADRPIDDEDDDEDLSDEEEDDDDYDDEEVDVEKTEDGAQRNNPCIGKECRRGETCTVDKRSRAKCICIPQCTSPDPNDLRYQVCSKKNATYLSECELDRDHCLCRRQMEGCSTPNTGKIRLDYYGPCQELTPCSEREFKIFPERMREWLFIVMDKMAKRAEIPEYLDVLEMARNEKNHTHAVLWKFCDLDIDPHDRFVSRRELLYTIQSLKAMEHCLPPFLDHCDTDTDGKITLWEWGRCLGLEEAEIQDECRAIQKAAAGNKAK